MKARAIPTPNGNQIAFNAAVKENIELLLGQRGEAVKPLADTASSADIINKLNELIQRFK